nr:MG2 domain-containing protein [Acidobacteriota bacterium]
MKHTKMAVWVLIGLFGIISLISLKLGSVRAQKPEGASQYQALKAQAEKLFAEKSYALAREQYVKVNLAELPPAEARWVQFRLADTLWRSQAATETSDSTQFDQAQHQLEVLVRDIQLPEDRDLVWAEVQESLGDFWWLRRQSRNWWQGWQYYQQALGYWGNSVNLDQARDRYLAIVFRMTGPPPWADQYYRYGNYGSIPQDIVANARKIAKTPDDRAHTAYLMAASFRYYGGQWEDRERVPSYFEEALKAGKQTEWYDDALFEYAQWMENTGNISWSAETDWKQTPDYLTALDLYRRLTTEFKKGDTRYFDEATEHIKNITRPVIGVSVSNVFVPGSLIDYSLNWRNVKRIDLALYPVDLTQDIRFGQNESSIGNWLQTVNLAGKSTVKTWAKDTGDKGDHRPQYESLRLDDPLPVGAYVLEASAGNLKARELVLVTNAALVVKSAPSKLVALMTDAGSGAPLAGAKLKVFEQYYQNSTWKIREHALTTNENGLAETQTFPAESTQHYFWVSGQHQEHQAICSTDQYTSRYGNQWKVYAFTDRPAYRPGESVQWKFVARSKDDQTWTTPANQMVEFEITDPRGTKVKEDKVKLNEFGSAWGSLDVTENMPLGEYRIQFWTQGRSQNIGSAQLFRLEEYKLPEFKVSVTTPEENGRKKAFKLGETVEVAVQADYYFGGPVANANVQVVVYQNPYYQSWQPPRDYPWFYQEADQRGYRGYGNGQVIKQETLKTDLNGKAVLTFDTPQTGQVDFEYRVEARVTDASRREIIGSDSVRVTRQRYYVYLQPDHTIYHPQDRVKIKVKAL